jgi:hypothetical protein
MTTNNTAFPVDPVQTAISVGYQNAMYIADKVLPRVGVGRQEFKYLTYPIEESFRLPDSTVGRRGKVNEVLLTAEEKIASTDDYGLEDPIPFTDIDAAQSAGMRSPVDHATMQLTDYILLGHEVRTAALVFDASNYPSTNKTQLLTTNQWNEFSETDSDPIDDILTGADAMLMWPTHMVMGTAVWRSLRVHPKIVAAIHGSNTPVSMVGRRQVADLFELEEVLVGESRLNTAKYGQPAVLGRAWGPHCLLFHVNPNADARQGLSWGYTAQYQTRVTGTIQDTNIGLRGGTRVRVGESVKELITAPLAAYLIEDAV